ncbi:hypothetical protein F750_3402 [Streptomyces sp. PAMC 26508]|nr:hypothetical protein F750_3402 [Streptomyces sp. PAMC 26508]
MVALIEIHENHAVSHGTSNGLRRSAGPAKTAIGADVVIRFHHDDDRLSEQGDHQRIALAGKCREQIDEMPP